MTPLLRQTLVFVLIIFPVIQGFAQEPVSKEVTLNYLNEKLSASDVFALKGKFLLIGSSRNGDLVKEDKINIYDLNPASVKYVDEEGMVIMKCFDDVDGCIERKTIKVSRKSFRNRVTFSVNSKEHGQKVVKAMKHLISLHADKKYNGVISLE